MPAAVAAMGAVANAIGTAILGAAAAGTMMATIVGAVVVVGTVALATRAIKRARQRKLAQAGAGATGSTIAAALVTKAGSSVNIPLVYGERRVSGQRVFIGSDGDKNKYLHLIESICEGPVEGLQEIYFNDELAATSTDNGATFTWETEYDTYVEAIFKDGSQTAALNTETISLDGETVNIHTDWAGTFLPLIINVMLGKPPPNLSWSHRRTK